jgi:carbamoyl-phosphate synthase large subunit
MPRPRLASGELSLRAIEPNDIEFVRIWRNAQMNVLRQSSPITPEAQVRYFAEHVWPDKELLLPRQILLAIERGGELIGYGGLVHISWAYRRAEISFLLEPILEHDQTALKDIFTRFLVLIQELAFADLMLHKLATETYAHRVVHIQALEDVGHCREGRLREHVVVDGKPMDALLHGILAHEWRRPFSPHHSTAILVTSASGKSPLIRAVKEASKRLGGTCVIAGDSDPNAPTKYEADGFWQIPHLCDDILIDFIKDCHARAISIILPTRDGELEFWANHRETFAQAGIEVIVSTADAIARCRDKLEFARFGKAANLPMIPAATEPDVFGDCLLVVKERFGAGSRGLGLKLSRTAAVEHAHNLADPVFQPFVSGPEISVDGWVGKDGRVTGVVLRRRDRVVNGESQVTTTFRDATLEAQAVRVLTALALRGPVVLQAIVVDGGLQVIECNPRFGGASTASIAVGLDTIYWSLAETLGHSMPNHFQRAPSEIRQVRMPTDRLIYGSDF